VHSLDMHDSAVRLKVQIFAGEVELAGFASGPFVADFAARPRLIDADRHRFALCQVCQQGPGAKLLRKIAAISSATNKTWTCPDPALPSPFGPEFSSPRPISLRVMAQRLRIAHCDRLNRKLPSDSVVALLANGC
jgi:hypothetical protein